MKQKTIVLLALIAIGVSSSFLVLKDDGYFDSNKNEAKVLSVAPSSIKQIAMAKETTTANKSTITKTEAPIKKKVVAKKKVVKKKKVIKHKLNLAPPVITPATAPFSAKNKNN